MCLQNVMVVEGLDDLLSIFHKVIQDLERVAIRIGYLPDATLLVINGFKNVFYKNGLTVRTAPLKVKRW